MQGIDKQLSKTTGAEKDNCYSLVAFDYVLENMCEQPKTTLREKKKGQQNTTMVSCLFFKRNTCVSRYARKSDNWVLHVNMSHIFV